MTPAAGAASSPAGTIELAQPLRDGTVVLRALRESDAAAFAAAFVEDPQLGRLIGVEQDPDEERVRARAAGRPFAGEGEGVELVIADPASDAFWGTITLHCVHPEHGRLELGLWVVPAARGRGVAAAAMSLALAWVFDTLGYARVELTTTSDNIRVQRLALRVGFQHEGILRAHNVGRGQRVDIVCFGLLREEWAGGASSRTG